MDSARKTFVIAASLALIGGTLFLVLGEAIPSGQYMWLRSLTLNLGGVVIASVAIGLLWEFWGKASFMEQVMDRVGMAHDLQRAGVRNVTNQYLQDVEWKEHIRSARHVDLFFSYARTW